MEGSGPDMPDRLSSVEETVAEALPPPSGINASIDPRTFQQFIYVGRRKVFPYYWRRLSNALGLALAEGGALLGALLLSYWLDFWLTGTAIWPMWAWALPMLWWGVGWFTRLYPGWGLGATEELRRIVMGLVLLFGGLAALLFLMKRAPGNGRFLLMMGCGLSLLLVPWGRSLAKRTLIRLKRWGVPTVVYGVNGAVEEVVQALQREAGLGYWPIGIFYADPTRQGQRLAGLPVLGDVQQNTPEAFVAVVAIPGLSQAQLAALLDGPLAIYRHIILVPDLTEVASLGVRPCHLSGRLALEISSNLSDPVARSFKRLFELVLVIGSMPLWLVLIGLLALVVWLEDRRAPFFVQERIGQNGRRFRMIKFRTMVPDAEAVLARYLEAHPELRAEWEANHKLKHDPRVTRVGRWLRRSSLDELPQLFNVLKGDMSLVGPRPLPAYHHDKLPRLVRQLRVRVRPGMTGLWQIQGRSDVGTEGMSQWDEFYVRNWSIWLDLVILVRTIRVVIKGHGAY